MIYPRAGTRVLPALPAIKGYTSYIIRIVLIKAQIVSESVRDKSSPQPNNRPYNNERWSEVLTSLGTTRKWLSSIAVRIKRGKRTAFLDGGCHSFITRQKVRCGSRLIRLT